MFHDWSSGIWEKFLIFSYTYRRTGIIHDEGEEKTFYIGIARSKWK